MNVVLRRVGRPPTPRCPEGTATALDILGAGALMLFVTLDNGLIPPGTSVYSSVKRGPEQHPPDHFAGSRTGFVK